ncbi:MAG: hypothetical protein QXP43_04340 [Nitrososphaerota archaeon]
MLVGAELTTLLAIGVVVAILLVFVIQVLGSVRRLTTELKLMREALQITVREVPQPTRPETPAEERPVPETPTEPSTPSSQETARPETQTSQVEGPLSPEPQQPAQRTLTVTAAEPVKFESLAEIARHFNLQGVVLFDSAGQVIDYVGDVEAEKVAALLAEAYSVISMSNEGVKMVLLEDDVTEAVARLEAVAEREVFVYVRPFGRVPAETLRNAVSSCSFFLRSMLGVRGE